jgi:uncharacterized membrane protein YheB (UPF0754 family)
MIQLSYIFTPLIAATIGYVTNDIAIRMLFRPHKAKYLWGYKLPFTPGLIPKEKEKIAASIGEAVSANLMNHDVMKETLLCDEMIEKVSVAFDEYVSLLVNNDEPLRSYLNRYMESEEIETLEKATTHELSIMVSEKLISSGLGKQIAHIAVEHALGKMQHGVAGLFRIDRFMSFLQEPTEKHLAKNIDEMLLQKAPEMTVTLVAEGVGQLMETPVKELFKDRDEQIASAKKAVIQLYRSIIEEQLPKMLEALDIQQIIEKRINEMDVAEVEKIIITLAEKELKAIVWFGAGLGFLIGLLNCIIL